MRTVDAGHSAAPQGKHQTNFSPRGGAATCLIHLVDDEWSSCFAFEVRQQGCVRLSDLEGTGSVVLDELETTVLTDHDLTEVVDYAGGDHSLSSLHVFSVEGVQTFDETSGIRECSATLLTLLYSVGDGAG